MTAHSNVCVVLGTFTHRAIYGLEFTHHVSSLPGHFRPNGGAAGAAGRVKRMTCGAVIISTRPDPNPLAISSGGVSN